MFSHTVVMAIVTVAVAAGAGWVAPRVAVGATVAGARGSREAWRESAGGGGECVR